MPPKQSISLAYVNSTGGVLLAPSSHNFPIRSFLRPFSLINSYLIGLQSGYLRFLWQVPLLVKLYA